MNSTDYLDYKKYPNKNLIDLFNQLSKDREILDDYIRTTQSDNLMYQHRVYITPTLYFYDKGTLEESNKVLR